MTDTQNRRGVAVLLAIIVFSLALVLFIYRDRDACEGGRCVTIDPAAESYCGNNICDNRETMDNCSQDCRQKNSDKKVARPYCGDKACGSGETAANCPGDCPDVCGDGFCGSGEMAENCPADCGADDCQAVCRTKGYLYALSECSSVNVLAKFNISIRVTCCCANENRINTCGNGVCQANQQENETSCPIDCLATKNKCAGENEAISGRECCAGLEPKCGEVPMVLSDGTTKMSLTGCWCIPKAASVCGNGVCSKDENGWDCPQDCPRVVSSSSGSYVYGVAGTCRSESECGICQSCSSGKCTDITTD